MIRGVNQRTVCVLNNLKRRKWTLARLKGNFARLVAIVSPNASLTTLAMRSNFRGCLSQMSICTSEDIHRFQRLVHFGLDANSIRLLFASRRLSPVFGLCRICTMGLHFGRAGYTPGAHFLTDGLRSYDLRALVSGQINERGSSAFGTKLVHSTLLPDVQHICRTSCGVCHDSTGLL